MTRGFFPALLDPHQPVPKALQDAQARPAGRRFDVYRNNVAHSLRESLRLGFPVVTRLLGRENMDRVSGVFLRVHPPSDARMMYYGAKFPEFLASAPQVSHMAYLADVARLELAIRRAYHAGDATPMPREHLSARPPEALVQATFRFAPAVQVLRSDWPVLDIWNGADTPDARAQDVLITRPGFDPIAQALPLRGAAWVLGLMAGMTIGEALEAAEAEKQCLDIGLDMGFDMGLDMGKTLTLLLLGGALVSLD